MPGEIGSYLLDAVNYSAPQLSEGAYVRVRFPHVELYPLIGGLSGGQLEVAVVPEPATFELAMIGALILALRRSRAT